MAKRDVPFLTLASGTDSGEAIVGIADCLLGLGVALANAGLVSREQIAAAMAGVVRQQRAQNAPPQRTFAAESLLAFFSAELITDPKKRFPVIDGGDAPGHG